MRTIGLVFFLALAGAFNFLAFYHTNAWFIAVVGALAGAALSAGHATGLTTTPSYSVLGSRIHWLMLNRPGEWTTPWNACWYHAQSGVYVSVAYYRDQVCVRHHGSSGTSIDVLTAMLTRWDHRQLRAWIDARRTEKDRAERLGIELKALADLQRSLPS